MVLISIHPFAFRKIFLVLLALLGFSALCFADPVLMARRYSRDHSPVVPAISERPMRLQLTEITPEISAGNRPAALEATETQSSFSFQIQPYKCAREAFGDLASALSFCPTTSSD
jgi:hypothetical protein